MTRCDNAAVVATIGAGTSKDSEDMHLMHCLAFISAKFEFSIFATHISGIHNDLADALSRNNICYFLSNYTQAHHNACKIPNRSAHDLQTWLDIAELDQSVDFYFQKGLATSAKNRYTNFCRKYTFTPLPVSENQLP